MTNVRDLVYNHLSEVAQIGNNPVTDNHIADLNHHYYQMFMEIIGEDRKVFFDKFNRDRADEVKAQAYTINAIKAEIRYQAKLKLMGGDNHA